jgi:hypothetical protein
LFGNENSIGKLVKINEGSDYTVTAVIKDIPATSQMKFDLLMPVCDEQDWMKTWNSKWTQTYVMLQDKGQFKDVNQKISGVMNLFQPSWKNNALPNTIYQQALARYKRGRVNYLHLDFFRNGTDYPVAGMC